MPIGDMEIEEGAPVSIFQRFKNSNYVTVFIVFLTLMTDTILYSVIVPILPKYFYLETVAGANRTVNTPEVHQTSNYSSSGESDCPESKEKAFLATENLQLSLLLASKQFIQIFANIAVGPVIDKIGHDIPMLFGYVIMIATSLGFAFGQSYGVLLTARALQGVGSACATTAGMAMIAAKFRDDAERGKMLGIAIGGFGLGVLIGPTFGSLCYQFGGKPLPFIVLAVLSFVVGLLQAVTGGIGLRQDDEINITKHSQLKLLKDPYVILSAVAIIIGGLAVPAVEASMPLWMMSSMCAEEWMLGAVFLPGSVGFLVSSVLFGCIGHRIGRWSICALSFVITAAGCVGLPFCTSFFVMTGPVTVIGFAAGMLDAAMYPIIGFLVDNRFEVPIYGSAYALADAMYCVPFTLGPPLAGFLVPAVGFTNTMFIICAVTLSGLVPTAFLRKPLAANETCTFHCCFRKHGEEQFLLTERSRNIGSDE